MAEAAEERFVRCPKCGRFLRELPGMSAYRCGGCDAVLRSKKNGTLAEGFSEVSDDVKGSGHAEEVSILKGYEVDMESGNGVKNGGVGRNHNEGMASDDMPRSRDSDNVKRGKERMRRFQTFHDEYESYTHGLVRNSKWGKNGELNVVKPEYGNFLGENLREAQALQGSLMSRPCMELRGMKNNAGGIPAGLRNGDFLYQDEGQSSYHNDLNHEQRDMSSYLYQSLDELSRIKSLENGRDELLKKLDELKDQLTRSCDVTGGKLDDRTGNDHGMPSSTIAYAYNRYHSASVQEGLISSQGPSKQSLGPSGAPQYFGYSVGFIPHADRCSSRVADVHPQRGHPDEFLHYCASRRPEMIHGPTQQCQTKYREQLYFDQFPGYYGDVNHDHFKLHRPENFFHQSACSCVHCCEKNWRTPPIVDHPCFQDQRFQTGPSNPNFHQNLNPVLHQPRGHNSGGSNLPPSHPQQNSVLQPNDLESENDGISYHRPRKIVVAHRRAQLSYPIAGGAPFMTCDNCFELLKLSQKHISLAKNQQKIKCGACSSIILFDIGNKGFFVSAFFQVDQVPTQVDEGSNRVKLISFSNNRDDSQRTFATAEKGSTSGGSERQMEPLSSASSLYNEVESPEKVASRSQGSPSAESPVPEINFFQVPDLPPQELPNQYPEDKEVRRLDKVDKSQRAEGEKVSFVDCEEHSVENTAVATEISVNVLSNSYVSQDSVDTNKVESLKSNKGGESFFGALIKKGFRELTKSSRGTDVTESQVFVNGHLIPDREVKKAEKLAGPIRPGDYWYDKKAGFWGVMGHPCMGIIMPNIKEFKYPMPKNCAAGNSGVFVNGRELNQRDLDLLVKRGLPITKNISYLIQITGEVVDEHTGEELDGLGKLAPSVQRAKHGFGMKVPRFLADSRS